MDAKQMFALLNRKIETQGVKQEKVNEAVEKYFELHPLERLKYDSINRIVR